MTGSPSSSAQHPHTGYRIVNAEKGVPGAERTLALILALTFVAAGILLIGCVGVSSGVSAWLDRKRHNIAILKSLGAPPPLVLRIYLVQVAGAAGIGAGAGQYWGRPVRRRPAAAGRLASGQSTPPCYSAFGGRRFRLSGGAAVLAAAAGTLRSPAAADTISQRPGVMSGTAAPRRLVALAAVSLALDSTVRRRDALADRGVGVHHGRRTYGRGFSTAGSPDVDSGADSSLPVSGSGTAATPSRASQPAPAGRPNGAANPSRRHLPLP